MEWVRLQGPFGVGAEVVMKPKGQDPITSVITEAIENQVYADETKPPWTRMINNDVSQPAVQRMLDHDSAEMTARYARIHDQTLRREWERYQERINIAGEIIHLDPAGPLSDAAWTNEDLARAKQTLPNGYCGLPLQQTCRTPTPGAIVKSCG
jgi:hypothetical protein